jgi:transposase
MPSYNARPEREGIVADKDMLTMSRREAMRLHILHQALERKVTQREAARLMSLSDRQVRRLLQRVRREGDAGICHRARDQASNHRIAPPVKARALALFRHRYSDFNLVHATEKLAACHGITLHAETLRLWVRAAGLPYQRRKARTHRRWRERKAHRGELLQFDGSHHDWFEGRGPRCVFLGAIDDATSTVAGRFYDYEGTWPAMDSLKRYIRRYGIPQAIYLDKHTTYKSGAPPTLDEQLRDQPPLSQVEQSLAALGITVIHANSPQAKGRVERLFKTLQDRLVRELRLRGIQSVADANVFLRRYLPEHNRRFCQPAASPADLHRPAPPSRELDRVFCIRTARTVKRDFTVAHNGKLYQIEQATRAQKVTVEERLDGTLHLLYHGKELRYRSIARRPPPGRPAVAPRRQTTHSRLPPLDHPWRRRLFPKRPTKDESHSVPG